MPRAGNSPRVERKQDAERSEPESIAPETYSRELMMSLGYGEEYLEFLNSGGAALRPRVERSLSYGRVAAGLRVMDVGCGRGQVVLRAQEAGAETIGIDYSVECVRLARETLTEIGQQASLAVADATSLPFAEGVFDRIFLLDVIEHLHEQHAIYMMKELGRVLRDSGYIVIHTLPNRWALSVGYRLMRLVFRQLPKEPRSSVEQAVHVGEQDILTLHRILVEAGLSSHIWLDGSIAEQAGWEGGAERGHLARKEAYAILRRPVLGTLYRLAMRSPLRLLFANDIYCVAWRSVAPKPGPVCHDLPAGVSERLMLRLAGRRG